MSTNAKIIRKVLIANRGEIARRIARSVRALGMQSVAVFSDADEHAPHVRECDEAVRIGAAPSSESYLQIDRIVQAHALPLSLPLPRDPRALRLAERLQAEPSLQAELAELAREAGASPRTIQRLFLAETGLPFSQCRQRLRLLHAATLLGEGRSVTAAGFEAGYAGTSAFIAGMRDSVNNC